MSAAEWALVKAYSLRARESKQSDVKFACNVRHHIVLHTKLAKPPY